MSVEAAFAPLPADPPDPPDPPDLETLQAGVAVRTLPAVPPAIATVPAGDFSGLAACAAAFSVTYILLYRKLVLFRMPRWMIIKKRSRHGSSRSLRK